MNKAETAICIAREIDGQRAYRHMELAPKHHPETGELITDVGTYVALTALNATLRAVEVELTKLVLGGIGKFSVKFSPYLERSGYDWKVGYTAKIEIIDGQLDV